MQALSQPSKQSILIGLLSLMLLFSPGTASVKSPYPTLKNPRQTEATHRIRQVKALHALRFVATHYAIGYQTRYPTSALIDAHSRLVKQVLKTSYHPIADDLLNAHHTYLKIAPGIDQDALS
jgi:hypothetical protein